MACMKMHHQQSFFQLPSAENVVLYDTDSNENVNACNKCGLVETISHCWGETNSTRLGEVSSHKLTILPGYESQQFNFQAHSY